MKWKKIDFESDIFHFVDIINEMLNEQNINFEIIFDGKEHNGYELIKLMKKGEINEKIR